MFLPCFYHVPCFSREWTCEECTDGLVQIATIFVEQNYIDDIIAFLQVAKVMEDDEDGDEESKDNGFLI